MSAQTPRSVEAEQAVIGGVLIAGSEALDRIEGVVRPGDFTERAHCIALEGALELHARDTAVDLVTLGDHLLASGRLEAAGGMAYLADLARNIPGVANLEAYAARVRERAIERQLLEAAGAIAGLARGGRPVAEKLDQAEALVLAVGEQRAGGGPVFAREGLRECIDDLDQRFTAGGRLAGLSTGIGAFDDLTGGLRGGDLAVLAARPGMGKTAFALGLALHAAIHKQVPALFVSLEMPRVQLLDRALAGLGRVDLGRIRTGRLEDSDWPGISAATGTLSEAPLAIDDSPGLTLGEIRARARRMRRRTGLGLLIVDYLQLVTETATRRNNFTGNEIVEAISRGLKALAKELDVPVIALSQLNRELERRPDKRPQLSDLRGSGAIEQDADLVAFLYRDEVYDEQSPARGTAELILAKQRNGPLGMVRLAFHAAQVRFKPYDGPPITPTPPSQPRRPRGFDD